MQCDPDQPAGSIVDDVPFPRWLARLNRRVNNRLMIRLAHRPPFAALHHVGRSSGIDYRIPVNAFPTPTGFCFALTYGGNSDWVLNVLDAERAALEYRGERIDLVEPRLVTTPDAEPFLPRVVRVFLAVLRVKDFMICDRSEPEAA